MGLWTARRLRLRVRPGLRVDFSGEPARWFLALGLGLLGLCGSSSCVAHTSMIEGAWQEAVRRSGIPREEIRRPELIEPPAGLHSGPLPRDERNGPVVAQYFPLTHQVRIYARVALPMRRILLREFLYAIYFDQLTSRSFDVEALSSLEPARDWVDQALARPLEPAR